MCALKRVAWTNIQAISCFKPFSYFLNMKLDWWTSNCQIIIFIFWRIWIQCWCLDVEPMMLYLAYEGNAIISTTSVVIFLCPPSLQVGSTNDNDSNNTRLPCVSTQHAAGRRYAYAPYLFNTPHRKRTKAYFTRKIGINKNASPSLKTRSPTL